MCRMTGNAPDNGVGPPRLSYCIAMRIKDIRKLLVEAPWPLVTQRIAWRRRVTPAATGNQTTALHLCAGDSAPYKGTTSSEQRKPWNP